MNEFTVKHGQETSEHLLRSRSAAICVVLIFYHGLKGGRLMFGVRARMWTSTLGSGTRFLLSFFFLLKAGKCILRRLRQAEIISKMGCKNRLLGKMNPKNDAKQPRNIKECETDARMFFLEQNYQKKCELCAFLI